MCCRVDGCENEVRYKIKRLCQKHYHRIYRNGHLKLKQIKAVERRENPAGYVLLHIPNHPLANKNGYVYEHRKVAYDKYNVCGIVCDICGKPLEWSGKGSHIDHIDGDVKNNSEENLRPLCITCNTRRNLKPMHARSNSISITFNGETKTASEWERDERVTVSRVTIKRRIESGMSYRDALFKGKYS